MKFDLSTQALEARDAAVDAIRRGDLVVLPTDTVYGIAADAFNPAAVTRLLAAKDRGRAMPPPVLVSDASVLAALTIDVPAWLSSMVDELWPGALTVICHAQPSLTWDLGDTKGTIAVRVPDHDDVRDLLRHTGPLAVSSANISGQPAADSIEAAERMFAERVPVYLDGGPSLTAMASTILDATSVPPRVVREGGVSMDELHRFNNTIERAVPDA